MTRLALAVLACLALAACGGGSDPPQTLPGSALPGMRAAERSIGPDELAQDAVQVEAARAALERLGLAAGVEQEFTGHTPLFDHVVARTLRFDDDAGAAGYLGWLRTHADEVLGDAKPETALGLGEDGVAFTLVPCGACKHELPTYLAAWRRGDEVATLLAAGRGANAETFRALAEKLDAVVSLQG